MKTAQNITKWNTAKEALQLAGEKNITDVMIMDEYVRRGGAIIDDQTGVPIVDKKAKKVEGAKKTTKRVRKAK